MRKEARSNAGAWVESNREKKRTDGERERGLAHGWAHGDAGGGREEWT